MPRYIASENLPYFCTITVLDWLPVLTEARYVEPILDSFRFCRQQKGLKLYAFVIMPNHMHLICSAAEAADAKETSREGIPAEAALKISGRPGFERNFEAETLEPAR